jgi:hypothetical protein
VRRCATILYNIKQRTRAFTRDLAASRGCSVFFQFINFLRNGPISRIHRVIFDCSVISQFLFFILSPVSLVFSGRRLCVQTGRRESARSADSERAGHCTARAPPAFSSVLGSSARLGSRHTTQSCRGMREATQRTPYLAHTGK